MPLISVLRKVILLGRPNVGKSTLFNRLIRSNRAITHDRPGVTRDRMEGVVRSRGQEDFVLTDTGGISLDSHARVEEGPEGIRGFETAILKQARDAVRGADLLCLVVDALDGLTPFDSHLANFLRKEGKPLLLVVNKVDGPERQNMLMAEFHSLGLDMLYCSAAHGWNVRVLEEDLRNRLFPPLPTNENAFDESSVLFAGASRRQKKILKTIAAGNAGQDPDKNSVGTDNTATIGTEKATDYHEETLTPKPAEAGWGNEDAAKRDKAASSAPGAEDAPIVPDADASPHAPSATLRLALLGRPNAGKSSLVNALAGKNRMIVSEIAGTTRDSVDVAMDINGEHCVFVDTPGVRRRAKVTDTLERYSVNSSLKSTTKAHVTLLVLDASEGITQQDKRLIELLSERKTPFAVLVNKSDLIVPGQRKKTERVYKDALVFCPHVPLLFVSAYNKHNLREIVPLARKLWQECGVRISTGRLNRGMTSVIEQHQPPIVRRSRAKFFYLTQAESLPPTFVFFVNDAEKIPPAYARYLERALRRLFGITHAPVRVHFRSAHVGKTKRKSPTRNGSGAHGQA